MPFKPIGERHAIEEVVFLVAFSRAFSAIEIDRVVEKHELWKSELPKLARPQVIQVSFGVESDPDVGPPPPVAPAAFQSFKRDGSLDWQVKVENNLLSVNCLTYSRWDAVSRQARSLLEKIIPLLADQTNRALSVGLQYIDTFLWSGDLEAYNADGLFNRKSGFFSDKFMPVGPYWHFHQGEYDYIDESPPKRILERVHLDAVMADNLPRVRIDTMLRSDFAAGSDAADKSFRDEVFKELEDLHIRNKKVLATVISEELQNKISLNREG